MYVLRGTYTVEVTRGKSLGTSGWLTERQASYQACRQTFYNITELDVFSLGLKL